MVPSASASPSEQRPHAGGQPHRPPWDASRDTACAISATALSGAGLEPCPAVPRAVQPHPGRAALAGRDRVDPRPRPPSTLNPAGLADRLGAPVEELAVLAHDVPGAVLAGALLVGEERQDEVAARPAPLAQPPPDDGERHGQAALHVDGAAPPHAPVADLARERRDGPLGGVGGDHVQVPVDQERGMAGIGAGDAGQHAGASRPPTRRSPVRRPRSASSAATCSAAGRSGRAAPSPRFVVSNRIRSRADRRRVVPGRVVAHASPPNAVRVTGVLFFPRFLPPGR